MFKRFTLHDPLFTLLALLICAIPAPLLAGEIEWEEHTVDGDFDGARYVFAADVDGDADLDVLGVAELADDITWWENTTGDGTVWREHTVDGDFDGARKLFAADVDDDGDLDVLGTALVDADITWWENTTGDGTVWTEHTVDGDFGGAASVHAADVDDDGDLDVLGAAVGADGITWWENVTPTVISIDIKPGNDANPINPRTKGKIKVAILTTSLLDGDSVDFDAWDIDPMTVTFGPIGAPVVNNKTQAEDVDHDGDVDMVLQFNVDETGIACGDTEAGIAGETFDGEPFEGTDSIETVGCACVLE